MYSLMTDKQGSKQVEVSGFTHKKVIVNHITIAFSYQLEL
jgi:hypothetical protein